MSSAVVSESAKSVKPAVVVGHDPDIFYSKNRDGSKTPIFAFTTADIAHNLRRGRAAFVVKVKKVNDDGTCFYHPLMLNYSDKGLGKVRFIFGDKSPKESVTRKGAKSADYVIQPFNDVEADSSFAKAVARFGGIENPVAEAKARLAYREWDLLSDLEVINAAINLALTEHAEFKYSKYNLQYNAKRSYNAKLPLAKIRKVEETKLDEATGIQVKTLIQKEDAYDLGAYINQPGKVQFELGAPYFMAQNPPASDTMSYGPTFTFIQEKYLPFAEREEIERAKIEAREAAKAKKEKEEAKTKKALSKTREAWWTGHVAENQVVQADVSADVAVVPVTSSDEGPDLSGGYAEYVRQFSNHCAALEDVDVVAEAEHMIVEEEPDSEECEDDEDPRGTKRSRH